jgi:hypothetical protein
MSTKRIKKKKSRFKLEPKPLTEDQITIFVQHYNKNGKFPGSKIPCNVTGKLTACSGPWMIKKIKEYGGPEQLLRKYKCRGATKKPKLVSKKKKKNLVLKECLDEQKNWNLPKITFNPPQKLGKEDIAKATNGTCFRPDIYLNNDRSCEGCSYFDHCVCALKRLAKKKR